MQRALLRLFNGVRVVDKTKVKAVFSKDYIKHGAKNGYILQPEITPTQELISVIDEVLGIGGEKMNATFHKSWKVVQDTPMAVLVIQQLMHYLTTYGFEEMGIYDESTVYIPVEDLCIPDIKKNIPLAVVRAMSDFEIEMEISSLGSGIALAEKTLQDIMTVVEGYLPKCVDLPNHIKNRELKSRLQDFFGTVPQEPTEFLRYVVNKLTDESLLIKNDYLVSKILGANGKFLDTLMKDAPANLAEIFFRYRPLFLAMKRISRDRGFYNRLRKKATFLHKPLPEDTLNAVTANIKHGTIDLEKIEKKLKDASIFRKARLAQALLFRLSQPDEIMYTVRNGKGWLPEDGHKWDKELMGETAVVYSIVLQSIAESLSKKVDGKTIYIPEGIEYTLPATEKQFIGNLPSGTSATVQKDLLVGIHWYNNKRQRVDLDMSLITAGQKIGWNASYRTKSRSVLFSGDVTDAPKPKGATEVFYIRRMQSDKYLISVNFYNYSGEETDMQLFVASENPEHFGMNYAVDPNNILLQTTVTINTRQNVIGMVMTGEEGPRVVFSNFSFGNKIASAAGGRMERVRQFLIKKESSTLNLNRLLVMAGANVTSSIPEEEFIDLSPGAIDKTTIIDLIQ